MKYSVLLGRPVRFHKISEPPGGIYIPDAIKVVQEHYGFFKIPTRLENMIWNNGITFNHGRFKANREEIIIDSLKIFFNGIVVESRSHTELVDEFIDHLLSLVKERKLLSISDLDGQLVKRAYLSNVEVTLSHDVAEWVLPSPSINGIAKEVTEYMRRLGFSVPAYQLTGFSIHTDTSNMPAPTPLGFALERRTAVPFSSLTYCTVSNL